MADKVKLILARPIQLGDQVVKAADNVNSMKQECAEIKAKTEKLLGQLRQAARSTNDIYERPTRRIMDDTGQVLDKALSLIIKCSANGFKRVFTIIPTAAFRKISQQLDNSYGDVSWLLRVTNPAEERDDYLGLPPIASNEPILCLIWEQIAVLCSGSLDERSDAAASLVSLARDNDRYGKLIIEEGGVVPLLKLAKEGRPEGQENAARAIGLLGRDPESIEHIVNGGVCQVFAKILKDGPMKIQVVVAWAVSEMAAHHPKCQDHFAQTNTIRLLVGHLAFETIQEHSKYVVPNKHAMTSLHTIVMASKTDNNNDDVKQLHSQSSHPLGNNTTSSMHNLVSNTMTMKNPSNTTPSQSHPNHAKSNHTATKSSRPQKQQRHQTHGHDSVTAGTSHKAKESVDPATKAQMKAMAARALWHLCAGNVSICSSITESKALLCFAVLLENGPDDVQYNSVMALMEITAVAEQNADLRRNAFKPTSPAAKALVDQFMKIIKQADSDLLIPCIRAVGNLARTFRATETRIIAPIVQLLDEREPDVSREAANALIKFACTDNYLHANHSNAIIDEGGAKHLIQLVYFGEQIVQLPALILLSYLAMHVPDSETLAKEEVLIVLEWATKQGPLVQDHEVEELLFEAKSRLELYQSRGTRGYH
ncbi:uncharacterized protein LOC132285691 [Cornus florida]|uniref:uncharacterized protein LOC132285691 n=1 Tax=Cornus florida TaxID=4283 RepID=UPI00289CAB70|nr:uncharacterized protein LOC132285691 [Cornus florida]